MYSTYRLGNLLGPESLMPLVADAPALNGGRGNPEAIICGDRAESARESIS